MTESNPSGSINIAEICAQELARRDWHLAAEPTLLPAGGTFVEAVAAHVADQCSREQRQLDEALVRRAIVHIYCHLLHRALSTNGSRLQSVAIQETINYGWPLALQRCRDNALAESAILHAVNKLWLNVDKCQPGAYLAFFTKILLREIGQEWRNSERVDRRETSESNLQRSEDASNELDDWDSSIFDKFTNAADAFRSIDIVESRTTLFDLLRDCLKNPKWVHILLGRFYAELNPTEIAQQLAMRVQQVYVEQHRAIDRIKRCCKETLLVELQLLLS
jgi:RNA polymerase sigma factor (sigma-70 family)